LGRTLAAFRRARLFIGVLVIQGRPRTKTMLRPHHVSGIPGAGQPLLADYFHWPLL